MTPTQEHLLKLVLEIDSICRKHNLQYFLAFGSILGAVRHHGFIPWDNDVDLSMPEDDYEKFRLICSEELDPEHRVFVDNRSNREYPVVFGHYVDRDSCRMTSRTVFWDDYVGQCIDIFSMVELPPEPEKELLAMRRFFAYDEFINRSFMHYMQKPPEVMELYRSYQEKAEREGREAVLQELESEIFGHHYEGANTYILCSARIRDPRPFVPKKPFDNPIEMEFEGHPLFIPGDYVTVMESYYGEDFNMFPRSRRIHTEMSHTGLPVKYYVHDFMQTTDKKKLLKARAKAKDLRVDLSERETLQTREFYRALRLTTADQVRRSAEDSGVDIEKLAGTVDRILEGGPYTDDEIRDMLSPADEIADDYYRRQLAGDAIYWRSHIDIGEDAEYAAMANLWLARQSRGGLRKLFAFRRTMRLPLTERMARLEAVFNEYSDLRRCMIYHDYEGAQTFLERCKALFPNRSETRVWELRYLAETADSETLVRQGLSLADGLLEQMPDNMYCRKAKADLLLKVQTGKEALREEAVSIYRDLKENCSDGFILLDIQEREEGGLIL